MLFIIDNLTMRSIASFGSFKVSNKSFTNQMIGQQLLLHLGKEMQCTIHGYYKYHKIVVYSADPHLNHQIFIRKNELLLLLQEKIKSMFGVTIVIKDIFFRAQSYPWDTDVLCDIDMSAREIYQWEDL